MAHFAIEDLTFSYPQSERLALDQVSFEIKHGEYLCVCGRSGCGKTTLLRHLKTVLTPAGTTSGRVLFNGKPLDEVDQRAQSSQIGFVMQNPDAQIVTDKVWHELAFGLESLGTDQSTMRLRVAEMASYFGIQGWFHRDVRDFSGGQKQLLNLASIMAMQPTVLILDEPTSQLDPIAASDFLNTVRKINIELGTTIVITEHRLEDVFSTADRVLVMQDGRVSTLGTPREVSAELHATGNAMTYALPAPVRIYYGVEAAKVDAVDAVADAKAREKCPLTVREGRKWLTEEVLTNPPARTYLPDERAGGVVSVAMAEGEAATDGVRAAELGGQPALDIREVWFRYDRDAPDVLRGVNLEVEPNQLFALVGGNGTGKSTLLKCSCGIQRPYRGSIRIFGKKIKDWKTSELYHEGVAMLPQDPQNLFVKKTVREDLVEMLVGQHEGKADAEARIAEVAETCDVTRLLDMHPFDLSGGEQQRAALAKVLLAEPRLLLLDEPTKGIDSFFKRELAQLFDRLKASGTTLLMVSHDVEFCARFADSVAMFFDGGIVTANTPRRFFAQNSFYTTAANRMSRNVFANAVTDEDVIELCLSR